MRWIVCLYSALLFFLLTPGILITLPPKGKKMIVAAVHAILFGIIWGFTNKIVDKLSQ
jgi:hypothetical protein